ncbi:MAG: hypothetical protein ACRDVW_00795 [Acidimicrobiales bacterium]
MVIAGRHPTQRVWFSDPRTPARRMSVSSHPVDGVVVVSMWHGQTCTGTFRLPVAEAHRLIGALADAMATGLVEHAGLVRPRPTRPLSSIARWLGRHAPRPRSGGHGGLHLLK